MSDESKAIADQGRESKDLDLCPITPDAPSPLALAADTAGTLLGILGGVGMGITLFGSTFRRGGRETEPGDTPGDVVLNMYHAMQDTLPLSLGEVLPDSLSPASALVYYFMILGVAATLCLVVGRGAGYGARRLIDRRREQWTLPVFLDARSAAGITTPERLTKQTTRPAHVVAALVRGKPVGRLPSNSETPVPGKPSVATSDSEDQTTTARLQERFNAVTEDYARVEADPEIMLEAPAIRDVKVPTTAAFHAALLDATTALEESIENHELADAVKALEDAWSTAMDTALHIGLQGLSTAEKRRAERLWDTATAVTGVTDAERRAARDRVIAYLDQVVITLSTGETGHLSGTRVVDDHLANVALAAPARLALTR
ncbi:hypothetical protein ACT3SZ_15175 [Corynebacterium sp. AOP40-9SA-29]|uniref:hypothetical protein n=1 Tax=Corynebacterium sp. AOP40-9SA-29 TaxID=3457677 RepID=UPI0040331637